MIIHRLIGHHFKNRDDTRFYRMQAEGAIGWLDGKGVPLDSDCNALDLGCGHGIFGEELLRKGCKVVFADFENQLLPELDEQPFLQICLDTDNLDGLFARGGEYNLVICSNVLEHIARLDRFLNFIPYLLAKNGYCYLSWTNWLSPWGGHEFSPFHYFGANWGHVIYDTLVRKPRVHTPYYNLFPTSIGDVLNRLKKVEEVQIEEVVPRYYPELAFLTRVSVVREFLTWNCAVLLRRIAE